MILKHIQKQLHTCNILLLCHPGHRLRPATQSGTAVSAGAAPTAAGSAPGRRGAAAAGTAHPGPSAPATERRGPPPVARRQWAGGSGRPGPFVPALRQERCPMPQLPRLGQQCSGGGGVDQITKRRRLKQRHGPPVALGRMRPCLQSFAVLRETWGLDTAQDGLRPTQGWGRSTPTLAESTNKNGPSEDNFQKKYRRPHTQT